MGANSLPETVTRQCRGCDLNPGPSVPESSMSLGYRVVSVLVVVVVFSVKRQRVVH